MRLPTLQLAEKEIDQLADILGDIGTVVAVATILPSIFSEFNLTLMMEGVIISVIFWVASIKISNLWNQ